MLNGATTTLECAYILLYLYHIYIYIQICYYLLLLSFNLLICFFKKELFSFIIITCLTFVFHMAVVSYSCHRSYCTLNLLLLFMKISNCDIISSKAESSFYFLFHPFSISISPSLNQTTITMPPRGI